MAEASIDVEVSGFSDMSSEDEMPKIKSAVVVSQNNNTYEKVLASDGLIGSICGNPAIKYLVKQEGTFKEVVQLALGYIDTLPSSTKPQLLISAGSYDLIPMNAHITHNSTAGQEHVVKKGILRQITKQIRILADTIHERGGQLAVASLIPCPRYQCPINGANKKHPHFQNLISDLYVEINQVIYDVNVECKSAFPNLKSAVEVSRGQASTYPHRKQKKIETTKFDKNLIIPKENIQKKLLEMAMKNLIFMEENREKIRKRKAPQRGGSSKKKC